MNYGWQEMYAGLRSVPTLRGVLRRQVIEDALQGLRTLKK
jgi:hypothetical protein